LQQIPAIILTTSMAEEDISHCYANGANSYIIKPSLYSDLLQVVGALRSYWKDTVKLPARQLSHEH
ncbi:MAG: response regulator, partial [Marinobacter sp.]|nr:response regulator [Marinobacter sp.]